MIMKKQFFTACAAALLSLPLAAEGVLPLEGKWVQGPCSSASGLKLEGNKVVGVVEIPRKNMKLARYSADKKITPIKGDFELSATLDYATKDKLFLGYAYIQAVDTGNKVLAAAGLYDGWERSASRNYASIVGSKAKLPVKYLPFDGRLDLKIRRQGKNFDILINGAKVMSGEGSIADFGCIRLVFQTDARKGVHYGAFEFADVKAAPLSADAPAAASVFDESFKTGFSADWVAVREMGCKGFVYDEKESAMTIVGFKDFKIDSKSKSVQYMLRRTFTEIKGDFSAVLDMAWELPADKAFLGAADIQLVTKNGTLIAAAGLTDGWIKGSARASASIGKEYLKERKDQPDKKSETFRIERKNGIISIYMGAEKLLESANNTAIGAVRFRLAQSMFRDKEGNNLSKFGRFTVKRIALDEPQGK